ncbi:MAG TPA: thioesterase domain-containing protein [Xanthobacteraceae bacterium]|jgi:pimeloyl-ACP methyl ester carboxylesterase|nr:thioesterase domain-containing protein [Xanthobacteraceae bacterium]
MPGPDRFVGSSFLRRLGAGAVILGALALLPAAAQSASKAVSRRVNSHQVVSARQIVSRPHVYLMRGLLNIFSLGMDQLAAQIERHGIDASVYNHTFADAVDAQIVRMYRAGDHGPYMLIGHSLGADAVMWMAQQLNAQGVPVALVVPVDGTGSAAASRNVACVINMTQRSYAYMRPGVGFHGILDNVDFSSDPGIDHLTIDKSPRVQAEALRYVLETAHDEECRPGITGPTIARSKQPAAPTPAAPKIATPTKTASPALRPGVAG